MKEKTYKSIMVGYTGHHTRDTHKLYSPETNMVLMSRDIKWS